MDYRAFHVKSNEVILNTPFHVVSGLMLVTVRECILKTVSTFTHIASNITIYY